MTQGKTQNKFLHLNRYFVERAWRLLSGGIIFDSISYNFNSLQMTLMLQQRLWFRIRLYAFKWLGLIF